jgi:uncharacterized tellurite resistance protein B-like protein
MNYSEIITRLYFLLTYADGHVNDKEKATARFMVKAEGMDEGEFTTLIELLKSKDKALIYDESLAAMKKLEQKKQIRIIAWLCVVANADGFMDRMEWQLIYKIYHKELSLPLSEIFVVQKELSRLSWENSLLIML